MSVICRLPQGGGSSDLIDFPMTLGGIQPTVDSVGHLWIDTPFASSITSIVISDAFTTSMPNGTMLLLISSLDNFSYSFAHTKLDTDGVYRDISMTNSNGTSNWTVINKNGLTYSIQKPMIYTKVNDNIYIEDAYWWNGTTWETLTNRDRYFMFSIGGGYDTTSFLQLYNYSETPSYSLHTDIMSVAWNQFRKTVMSKDGRFMAIRYETGGASITTNTTWKFYKRTGDIYTAYGTVNGGVIDGYNDYCMSDDGQYFAVTTYVNNDSTYDSCRVYTAVYKNNGSTGFVLLYNIPYVEQYQTYYDTRGMEVAVTMNSDGSCIIVFLRYYRDSTANMNSYVYPFFKNANDTWSVGTSNYLNYMFYNYSMADLRFINNQQFMYKCNNYSSVGTYDYSIIRYNVDFVAKTVSLVGVVANSTGNTYRTTILGVVGNILYFIKNNILYSYNCTTNTSIGSYAIPTTIAKDLNESGAISSDGRYIIISNYDSTVAPYYTIRFLKTTIDVSTFAITGLTLVNSLQTNSSVNYLLMT